MLQITRRDIWIALALAGTLLLTYAAGHAALTGPFIFDDYPNVGNLKFFADGFELRHFAAYLEAFPGDPGRPLSALSFLIDDQAWPSDPAPFKRTNLLLHLLNGVLVFGLVRSLGRARLESSAVNLAALLAAAAWLLHPMQLSTTMLVVQRMTQLMTLASLAAIWWASYYLQRAPLTLVRSLWLLAVTAFATVIAYLCKENGALLPLYVAVAFATVLRPVFQTGGLAARRLLMAGLWLPVVAIAAYLLVSAIQYVPDGLRDFTPIERLLTESRVLVDYLGRIALPRLSGSGLFHDDFQVSRGLLDPPATAFAAILCLGMIGSAIALRARMPLFSFAVLFYFGGHLLESTTYPLELYFEHRNYLPMVGPLAALALWLAGLPQARMRRVYLLTAVAWVAMCTGMTFLQARVWSSEAMLAGVWGHESPGSVRALELRVKVLVAKGHYDAAVELLRSEAAANPEMRKLALHQVLIECYRGRLEPGLIRDAAADMRNIPFNRSSLEALAMLRRYSDSGRCGSALTPASWQTLIDAVTANPSFARHPRTAAYLWIEKTSSLVQHRDLAGAMAALESSYQINRDPQLALKATELMLNNGLCERAEAWYRRREEAMPRSFDGWMLRVAQAEQVALIQQRVHSCKPPRTPPGIAANRAPTRDGADPAAPH